MGARDRGFQNGEDLGAALGDVEQNDLDLARFDRRDRLLRSQRYGGGQRGTAK